MSKLPSAKETAEVILQHVVCLHGFPVDMVSDRGPQFISQFWKAFCSLVGASVSLFSGFHPLSNVQTEQLNQELEKGLLVSWPGLQLSGQLLWIDFCVHRFLPLSPFQCVYGYEPSQLSALERELGIPSATALIRRCRQMWSKAQQTLLRISSQYKAMADRRHTKRPT